jgi:hypothetical protein
MSNVFIWIYSGGGRDATFMKHFKGGRKLRKFGNIWNNPCLQWESYETHKWQMQSHWLLNQVVHTVTTGLLMVNHQLQVGLTIDSFVLHINDSKL